MSAMSSKNEVSSTMSIHRRRIGLRMRDFGIVLTNSRNECLSLPISLFFAPTFCSAADRRGAYFLHRKNRDAFDCPLELFVRHLIFHYSVFRNIFPNQVFTVRVTCLVPEVPPVLSVYLSPKMPVFSRAVDLTLPEESRVSLYFVPSSEVALRVTPVILPV